MNTIKTRIIVLYSNTEEKKFSLHFTRDLIVEMFLWHHSCLKFNCSAYRVLVLVAGIHGGQSTQWF